MKEILLTQNKVALVDNEDYEWLSQWKWYADKSNNIFYARRGLCKGKLTTTLFMHREILALTFGNKLQIDHINHNGLDNQMNNKARIGTSKFKGVSWHKGSKKWRAYIAIYGKQNHLGHFINEIKAAQAYDNKAKELFGEYANLNFK